MVYPATQCPVVPYIVWGAETEKNEEESDTKDQNVSLSGKRILIAEDVEINAELLTSILEIEGIENEFCERLKETCNRNNITSPQPSPERGEGVSTDIIAPSLNEENGNIIISAKMLSTSTHIASLPVAVTINCHSNRHSGCEISKNKVIYDWYKKICKIYSYMKKGGIGSSLRWQHRKILNSPSPMETVNSYICKDFLLKKKT